MNEGRWTQIEITTVPAPIAIVGGRWFSIVGNAAYHTVGDREQAVRQMVIDFDALYADLGSTIGVLPYEGSAERVKHNLPWFAWWQAAAVPLFDAWAQFKAEQLSGDTTGPGGSYIAYGNRFETDWPVYEAWIRRLETLRASAKSMGIPLRTPAPASLPTTLPEDVRNVAERAAKKASDAGGDIMDLLKWALIGTLAIGGVVAVSSVAMNVKKGRDPIEHYASLARRGS